MRVVSRDLRALLTAGTLGELSDAQLLERYVARHEECAFAEIVHRHGRMVWGVCLRVLRSHHDAEDAFQATFLVLARKAATIHRREAVVNWLYAVALQTARKARAMTSRRRGREQPVIEADVAAPAVPPHDRWRELEPLLDQELGRLPEKYRSPIVLCDLEGKSRRQAAQQLGWPEGTLSSRLSRGRATLAARLARRGLVFSGGALAALLSERVAAANVPPSLVSTTVRSAALFAAGDAVTAGVISTKVAALAGGMLKSMLLTKLKTGMGVVLAVGLLGTGLGATGLGEGTQDRGGSSRQEPEPPRPANVRAGADDPRSPRRIVDALGQYFDRGLVSDASKAEEALRRIYLDVFGRTPTPEEVHEFLKDNDRQRRIKLVLDLLIEAVCERGPRALNEALAAEWVKHLAPTAEKPHFYPATEPRTGSPFALEKQDPTRRPFEVKPEEERRRRLNRLYDTVHRKQVSSMTISDCRKCHSVPSGFDLPTFAKAQQSAEEKLVRAVLVRFAVKDVEEVVKRLEDEMPDDQAKLDVLDAIEKSVQARKDRLMKRTP